MNKKIIITLTLLLIGLSLISAVDASNTNQKINSNTTNDNIQTVLDNADDGDTIEFTDKEYNNISLIIDKKLNIISKRNSVINIEKKADTGFYFTDKAAGSTLSGLIIIANNNNNAITITSDKITLKNNTITSAKNNILIKDATQITLTNNQISKAKENGIQMQNVKQSTISKNTISYNGRSGIETSNIYNCKITNNTIHHNRFNGISMYNTSNSNTIKYNEAYENPNGIYIDSQSAYDVINANSFTHNRRNTDYELGAFESGNGLLFGADFRTAKEGNSARLEVKYNVLAHNEGYQAKNNPELPTFKLGDNWFDSTDDANTFVCPMLLAGIMKMGVISVKNSIGLQMYDTKNNPVKEFGTFDTKVNVGGNEYTSKFINGKATIDATLEPGKEYDVEVMIGGEPVKFKYKAASGEKNSNKNSKTTKSNNGKIGASGTSSQTSANSKNGNLKNQTSNNYHLSNANNSGVYGTNASGTFQDSSDNGENTKTDGNINSGDASSGEVSQEGKAYEVIPPSKISKEVTDTTGPVVLSILALMGMFIYGYKRRNRFE